MAVYKRKLLLQSKGFTANLINDATTSSDGTLTRGIFYKLKDYPFEALYAGTLISNLTGSSLSEKEKKNLCMAGLVLALGDVLCDDTTVSEEQIAGLLANPVPVKVASSLENLLLASYRSLLENLSESEQKIFKEQVMAGFEIEKKVRQLNIRKGSKQEYEQLGMEKGGISLLIYLSLLNVNRTNDLTKALYYLGGLIDFIDDVFDIKWDYEKKTETAVTVQLSWDEIKKRMNDYYQVLDNAIAVLPFSEIRKRRFRFVFFLFLIGVESYIQQMMKKTANRLDWESMIKLTERDVHFNYISFQNLIYVCRNIYRFS